MFIHVWPITWYSETSQFTATALGGRVILTPYDPTIVTNTSLLGRIKAECQL